MPNLGSSAPAEAFPSVRRRRFIRATAGATAGASALLAGCSNDDVSLDGEEFPAIHEWLTETDVGGEDDTYDGTLLDRREHEEVRIRVGVDGNGGSFAYRPSAVAVSPGTSVRWVWVDDHEGHSVVADPDRQLGESDYEFSSGGPVNEEGHEYAKELDREGVALYHCEGTAGTHWSTGPSRGRSARGGDRAVVPAGGGAGSERPTAFGDGSPVTWGALHLESHRSLGMKGGVAVTD